MNEDQSQALLSKIQDVQNDLKDVELAIRSEMKLKHQAMDFGHKDHERRLSFTEKMLFGTAGLVLSAFILGLLALVFK